MVSGLRDRRIGCLEPFRPRRQFVPAHSRTASSFAKLDHRAAAAQHADHRCLAGEEPWLQLRPVRADRAIASPGLRLPQASQDATRPQRCQAAGLHRKKLLNTMAADEAVVFVDAVHPTHQVRAAGCWAPKDTAIAVEQTTGRQSLNIHGAINLETGQTQMLEVTKVNAMSLIALLKAIEAAHPAKKRIHVYLDNASYHHANIVRDWLKEQHRKSVLHFIPPYCPHLDPIEQCWALMHQHTTHNRDYKTFRQFKRAILKFLKHTIPKNWNRLCDRITDNFRVIHRDKFRVVA